MNFHDHGLRIPVVPRLEHLGLATPTPVRTKAMLQALHGRDFREIDQTGTGQAVAYCTSLVVAISRGQEHASLKSTRGLISASTREMVDQIGPGVGFVYDYDLSNVSENDVTTSG